MTSKCPTQSVSMDTIYFSEEGHWRAFPWKGQIIFWCITSRPLITCMILTWLEWTTNLEGPHVIRDLQASLVLRCKCHNQVSKCSTLCPTTPHSIRWNSRDLICLKRCNLCCTDNLWCINTNHHLHTCSSKVLCRIRVKRLFYRHWIQVSSRP